LPPAGQDIPAYFHQLRMVGNGRADEADLFPFGQPPGDGALEVFPPPEPHRPAEISGGAETAAAAAAAADLHEVHGPEFRVRRHNYRFRGQILDVRRPFFSDLSGEGRSDGDHGGDGAIVVIVDCIQSRNICSGDVPLQTEEKFLLFISLFPVAV